MPNQYVNKVVINNQTRLDLTGDTVTADKLMQGITAHDKSGAPIVGTHEDGGSEECDLYASADAPANPDDGSYWVDFSEDIPPETDVVPLNVNRSGTFTAPEGEAYSPVTVPAGSVSLAAPTVNASGLVTASATLGLAGYVGSAPSSKTLQLPTQAAQTITPGLSAQTIAAGKYLTGAQTINPITAQLLESLDQNFIAANIRKNVSIFGKTGTLEAGPEINEGQITLAQGANLSIYRIQHGLSGVPTMITAMVFIPGSSGITEDKESSVLFTAFILRKRPNGTYDGVLSYVYTLTGGAPAGVLHGSQTNWQDASTTFFNESFVSATDFGFVVDEDVPSGTYIKWMAVKTGSVEGE